MALKIPYIHPSTGKKLVAIASAEEREMLEKAFLHSEASFLKMRGMLGEIRALSLEVFRKGMLVRHMKRMYIRRRMRNPRRPSTNHRHQLHHGGLDLFRS